MTVLMHSCYRFHVLLLVMIPILSLPGFIIIFSIMVVVVVVVVVISNCSSNSRSSISNSRSICRSSSSSSSSSSGRSNLHIIHSNSMFEILYNKFLSRRITHFTSTLVAIGQHYCLLVLQ